MLKTNADMVDEQAPTFEARGLSPIDLFPVRGWLSSLDQGMSLQRMMIMFRDKQHSVAYQLHFALMTSSIAYGGV